MNTIKIFYRSIVAISKKQMIYCCCFLMLTGVIFSQPRIRPKSLCGGEGQMPCVAVIPKPPTTPEPEVVLKPVTVTATPLPPTPAPPFLPPYPLGITSITVNIGNATYIGTLVQIGDLTAAEIEGIKDFTERATKGLSRTKAGNSISKALEEQFQKQLGELAQTTGIKSGAPMAKDGSITTSISNNSISSSGVIITDLNFDSLNANYKQDAFEVTFGSKSTGYTTIRTDDLMTISSFGYHFGEKTADGSGFVNNGWGAMLSPQSMNMNVSVGVAGTTLTATGISTTDALLPGLSLSHTFDVPGGKLTVNGISNGNIGNISNGMLGNDAGTQPINVDFGATINFSPNP